MFFFTGAGISTAIGIPDFRCAGCVERGALQSSLNHVLSAGRALSARPVTQRVMTHVCRGPNGIWTLKKKKRPITAPLTPFEHAKPSFTHMVRVH